MQREMIALQQKQLDVQRLSLQEAREFSVAQTYMTIIDDARKAMDRQIRQLYRLVNQTGVQVKSDQTFTNIFDASNEDVSGIVENLLHIDLRRYTGNEGANPIVRAAIMAYCRTFESVKDLATKSSKVSSVYQIILDGSPHQHLYAHANVTTRKPEKIQ